MEAFSSIKENINCPDLAILSEWKWKKYIYII